MTAPREQKHYNKYYSSERKKMKLACRYLAVKISRTTCRICWMCQNIQRIRCS